MQQNLHPVVLFGNRDVVLVDCGYPGSCDIEVARKPEITEKYTGRTAGLDGI